MAYTLEQLTEDVRETLGNEAMPAAGGTIRAHVERALGDAAFLGENFGPDRTAKRTVVHEDPELGFCICVHVYDGAANGAPHDHGSSWAVYGQAEGVTEMSDWRVVAPAQGDEPARVERVRTYELRPGQAHFYAVGDVHSPARAGPTKLLRVEGANLDTVRRTPIVPVEEESV